MGARHDDCRAKRLREKKLFVVKGAGGFRRHEKSRCTKMQGREKMQARLGGASIYRRSPVPRSLASWQVISPLHVSWPYSGSACIFSGWWSTLGDSDARQSVTFSGASPISKISHIWGRHIRKLCQPHRLSNFPHLGASRLYMQSWAGQIEGRPSRYQFLEGQVT